MRDIIHYTVKEGLVREALATTGEIHDFEYHFKTLRGHDRWVVHNSFLRFDEQRDEPIVEAIIKDITGLKQASQDALAAEKEWLAVTLASISEAVIATDREGKVLFLNRVAQNLTGWPEPEALGRPLSKVLPLLDQDRRHEPQDAAARVLRQGRRLIFPGHTLLLSRQGMEIPIAHSGAPIRDRHNRVIGVVLAFRDITEERRRQDELARAQRLESLGLLAGGIAHDFNNMLTAILGNMSMAKMRLSAGPGSIENYLREAEKASLRARDLAQQLLTFAKGGAPHKKMTDLRPLITDAAEFALHGSNCRAEFHISPDLWPAEVDSAQLSQVIHNLVLNGQQAMPQGGVVSVCAANSRTPAPAEDPPLQVEIHIEDTGTGIPEKYLERIFDPYFTTKQKGSGIGLTTSYSIITRHGGTLRVKSAVGVGSCFTITLPAAATPAAEQLRPPKQVPHSSCCRGRVLIMDDEAPILKMAADVLLSCGMQVETVPNGEAALASWKAALAAGAPFDLVLLDLTIAGGPGGREVLQQLQKISPSVRAIASSGYCNDPVISDFSAYGFAGVLAKPYTAADLLHAVSALLSAASSN